MTAPGPLFPDAPSVHDCDVCDKPEGDLCVADERERDLERAERLAEEDRYLYGI